MSPDDDIPPNDIPPQDIPDDEHSARLLLKEMGQSEALLQPIGQAALALAILEAPAAKLATYDAHLARLGTDVRDMVGAGSITHLPVEEVRSAIAHVIYGLHGYQGDHETYDDLQNANLIRVIDRRRGLPVALGILVITVARGLGVEAVGLDFPGHFLVRIDCGGERCVIDPFNGAKAMDASELRRLLKAALGAEAELETRHYEPALDKDVLLRLQNNLKLRLIQRQEVERAAEIVEAMLMIAPERAVLWREAGLLNAHVGNLQTAILALETYVQRETRDGPKREAAELLAELQRKIN
jgi:regulator of sirC expression with transglutaminase-like and TPR domain